MPTNASYLARITQFLAIIVFFVFAEKEGSMTDIAGSVRSFPLHLDQDHLCHALACILRVTQAIFACYTVFLLVISSTDVIEIILNFTAVNQISNIDEFAFDLAYQGKYGDRLSKMAKRIKDKVKDELKVELKGDVDPIRIDYICLGQVEAKNDTERDVDIIWYLPTLFVVVFMVLSLSFYVTMRQTDPNHWEAKVFRVEFDKETGLSEYSGCYEALEGSKRRNRHRRAIYKSKNIAPQKSAGLQYCKNSRRWVFYEAEPGDEHGDEHCNEINETVFDSYIAQSSTTTSFSVTTAFHLNWLSMFDKPLDMYFFESIVEDDLYCSSFANDGKCDIGLLSTADFQFDGGDCCGTTCSKPDCGKDTNFTAFGKFFDNVKNDSIAIGYPNCTGKVSRGMVDLTVALPEANYNREDESKDWINFWSPSLRLECGNSGEEEKRIVFSIPVNDESMFGNNYSNVKVESDSVCDLIASNLEPFFYSVKESFSVAYVDISIDGIDTEIVKSQKSQNSIPIEFESLVHRSSLVFPGKYNLTGIIPTEIGSMTSLTELDLAQNKLDGPIPRQIGYLTDLEILLLNNNRLTGYIPWEHISLLNLTTLRLNNNNFEGSIPTEIGLLTKLTFLDLSQNHLTGDIPYQIYSLKKLEYLNLNGNDLKPSVNCSNFYDIWDQGLCKTLNSFPRWDSESPTTSPAPSGAPSVSNAPSVSPAPTISPPPTKSKPLTTVSPTGGCRSIADILCDQIDFKQMCTLMNDTAEYLKYPLLSSNSSWPIPLLSSNYSNWTIFAPTNAAIIKNYIDHGIKFNFDDLFSSHVVEGRKIFKEDLCDSVCDSDDVNLITTKNITTKNITTKNITTKNGKEFCTLCENGRPSNISSVSFVSFDMVACNGVIHTISDVLLDS